MPFEDFAIPGIGAVANIIGGAISRGQALKDDRRNYQRYLENREYNEPANQLKRIREAGLPSAAYFTGGASSQSAPPSGGAYETDNGIAAAGESIGKYMSTRMQRIQVEAMEEDLAIKKNQRKISDLETERMLKPEGVITGSNYDPETASYNEEVTIMPHYLGRKLKEEEYIDRQSMGKDLSNQYQTILNNYEEDRRKGDAAIANEHLKQEAERTAQAIIESEAKRIDLDYAKNEHEFKKGILTLRKMIFDSVRQGKMPSWRDLFLQGLLILENRL